MDFIDLKAQQARIRPQLDAAIARVLEEGRYVMGPQVDAFETALARFCGGGHALGCANGTDALALPLMAWGLKPGDAVFCPSFTFCATAEVVAWLGATPVFVDVLPDTYNLDPDHLDAAIRAIRREGRLRPAAIIGVCLFGQAADYPRLREIADREGLKLISDSAQGFGTTIAGRHPVDWADCVTTSFFPAKPLGCYGDGGAVVTHDGALAETIDSLRIHGRAMPADTAGRAFGHDPKYLNMRIGMNSRLDTLQAAILLEKLAIFPEEIELRNRVAARYSETLGDAVSRVPQVRSATVSTWAQYTIEHRDRDGLQAHLKAHGIPSAAYYPVPMHRNVAYTDYPTGPGGLPVTEAAADTVLSLPMHPYLDADQQDRVIEAVRQFRG